jgi:hypothetical protein
MNELAKKNQLLILSTYKDYYAFFTYVLSYSLHNITSMLNYDNVNYGIVTVVSIVLHSIPIPLVQTYCTCRTELNPNTKMCQFKF